MNFFSHTTQGWISHPKDSEDTFYLGFDTGHSQDLAPYQDPTEYLSMYEKRGLKGPTYKTIGYVKNECIKLAKQLKELGKYNNEAVKSIN